MAVPFGILTPMSPSSTGYNEANEWISATMQLFHAPAPDDSPDYATIRYPKKDDNSALVDIPISVSPKSAIWVSLNYGVGGLSATSIIRLNIRIEGYASRILGLYVYVGNTCVGQISVSGSRGQMTTIPLELTNIYGQTIQPPSSPTPNSSYTDIILIAMEDPGADPTKDNKFDLIQVDGEIIP
jgi:hypothetical protein